MADFPLVATAWAAVAVGAIYMWLTLKVIRVRRGGVLYGDNNDKTFAKLLRGQSNAAEQIPLALILLGFCETLAGTPYAIPLACLLVFGRLLHAIHFTTQGSSILLRGIGMLFTGLPQGISIVLIAYGLITYGS